MQFWVSHTVCPIHASSASRNEPMNVPGSHVITGPSDNLAYGVLKWDREESSILGSDQRYMPRSLVHTKISLST